MGIEIERKYLVNRNFLPTLSNGTLVRQGYLTTYPPVVRVRISKAGRSRFCYMTVKGAGNLKREEYEIKIPFRDAEGIYKLCEGSVIQKTRYRIDRWEIDEFHGHHKGLWIAEIELKHEHEKVELPAWIGKEVTEDSKYTNAALAQQARYEATRKS